MSNVLRVPAGAPLPRVSARRPARGRWLGVGIIRFEAMFRATGKKITDLEAHLFTFDEAGRVTHFRHFAETRQQLPATRS